jgi:hypothetical protein
MKQFTKRNEAFTCAHCGKAVPAGTHGVMRNHCPYCLASLHTDKNPGDRQSTCGGTMKAIQAYYLSGRITLVHRCTRCGLERKNRIAELPCDPPDDLDVIMQLMEQVARSV